MMSKLKVIFSQVVTLCEGRGQSRSNQVSSVYAVHAYKFNQEYIIKREGEYPTPLYPSVVAVEQGYDLYYPARACAAGVK